MGSRFFGLVNRGSQFILEVPVDLLSVIIVEHYQTD